MSCPLAQPAPFSSSSHSRSGGTEPHAVSALALAWPRPFRPPLLYPCLPSFPRCSPPAFSYPAPHSPPARFAPSAFVPMNLSRSQHALPEILSSVLFSVERIGLM
jgi:hypothetical protein